MICLGFFISVVSNSYSLIMYRINDVFDFHLALLFTRVIEDVITYYYFTTMHHEVELAAGSG